MLWILALAKARSAAPISAAISAKRATPASATINATLEGARQNAAAGFDSRVRVGIATSAWKELPAPGVMACRGLDYREIEAAEPIPFIEYARPALEALLAEKTGRAIFVEAWGEFYFRDQPGIHQVHSRRASCSVLRDYIGRDGAIRFYFGRVATAEMLLFKYCGQP